MSREESDSVTVGRELGNVEWEAVFVPGLLLGKSERTVSIIHGCLANFGRRMEEGYGLTSITQITRELVELYFAELAGLSASRIATHAAALRILCKMMDVPEMVPTNAQLGCTRISQKRKGPTSTVAEDDQKE